MPTYQYACTACGEQLEKVQSFTDPALTECPACQGALRKVFSAVGVVFKGSGFYKTDSRSEKKSESKPATKADAPAAKTESAPAKTESSSTPAATPTAKASTPAA
jgi:putative FmdB family regulatory protein